MNYKLLKTIGVYAIAKIKDNIKRGVDVDGNKLAYSENPFYRPYDQSLIRKLGGKKGEGEFYKIVFSKRTGLLGMIILGGYKKLKEKINPTAKNDFLVSRGTMLANMKVIETTDSNVTIGWTDSKDAEKAFWLNVSGASRSRKLWKFLGLRKEQIDELVKEFTPMIRDEIVKEKILEMIKK